jgi:hypothetical protein
MSPDEMRALLKAKYGDVPEKKEPKKLSKRQFDQKTKEAEQWLVNR